MRAVLSPIACAIICRGDDLVLDTVVQAAQHMVAPYIKLLNTSMVGYDNVMREVQTALNLASGISGAKSNVVVGVHGMGGVGKTTLARAVYDAAASTYTGRRIFLTIGDTCTGEEAWRRKRCQLLKELSSLGKEPSFASSHEERERLREALRSAPPKLLVLDDLWTRHQLHWLLACEDTENAQQEILQFCPGSRVLLTSRDQRLVDLGKHGTRLFHLKGLDNASSEQVLCQEAFGSSLPPLTITPDDMDRALSICGGLPLALQVLGRQLRGANWQVRLLKCNDTANQHSERADREGFRQTRRILCILIHSFAPNT